MDENVVYPLFRDDGSHREIEPREGIEKAIGEICRQLSAIIILAHPNKSKVAATRDKLAGIEKEWQDVRVPIDEVVRKVKQSLGRDTLDPDRLDWLTREEAKVLAELNVLVKAEQDLAAAAKRRKEMLEELRNARHSIFSLRRKQAELLTERLGGQVRVNVVYKGNTEEYMSRLASLLSGPRVDRTTLTKLYSARDMSPADGCYVAEAARIGPEELARPFDLTLSRAQQIVNWLMQDGSKLHELEMLFPDDEIKISMVIDGSGVPVEKLSDGQKATAVLLILLYSRRIGRLCQSPFHQRGHIRESGL